MRFIRSSIGISLLIFLSAFTILQAVRWNVSEDYSVKFSGSVNGSFRGLIATIIFDEKNLAASKIIGSVDAGSINTGIGLRNKHAKSESGLNAEAFPRIRFESKSIVKTKNGYEATGLLTIRDVVKEISLPFTFERTGGKAIFKGSFVIVPKDYQVTKSGTPDSVTIDLVIPVSETTP